MITNDPATDYEAYDRRMGSEGLTDLIMQQAEGILHNWAVAYCNRRERLGDQLSPDESTAFLRSFLDEAVSKEERGVNLLGEESFREGVREAIINEYEFRWGTA